MEQCNNYTWVLTAVAEGGKSRDVQGEELGVALYNLLFTGQVKVPCPGEPLLEPQGDPFLSAEQLLQEVYTQLSLTIRSSSRPKDNGLSARKSQRQANRKGLLFQKERMFPETRRIKIPKRRT